jgi:hypothetical protein
MELYTSEGCDSCPPAEAWFSGLVDDARLWKRLVPVTFHVDYWDYLGWRDPFDSHVYTLRQQEIDAYAGSGTVYTPQFVLDGHDWQSWFNHRPLRLDDAPQVGVLSLTLDGRKVAVHLAPTLARTEKLVTHVALLAFGVEVPVGAGENQGVTLRHDFLVVAYTRVSLTAKAGSYDGTLILPPAVPVKATRYALAAWVTAAGDPEPIQAAGGWLDSAP